jgi:hypothetical protein
MTRKEEELSLELEFVLRYYAFNYELMFHVFVECIKNFFELLVFKGLTHYLNRISIKNTSFSVSLYDKIQF